MRQKLGDDNLLLLGHAGDELSWDLEKVGDDLRRREGHPLGRAEVDELRCLEQLKKDERLGG